MHELDDLVFVAELRHRVLLLAPLEVHEGREAGDLEAFAHRLVHRGVQRRQNSGTLRTAATQS